MNTPLRFHVLGIPHTATNKDYVACAFTQKVLNLCKMLKMRGHYVIHYGNELSDVDCDENVILSSAADIAGPEHFLEYDMRSDLYARFTLRAQMEIARRKDPNDFLLCPWGAGHKAIADAHPEMIVCESGIGYGGGYFAPFKVFESYALLHAYYGTEAVRMADHFRWYEHVIPNSFDPADFAYNQHKGNYIVFLGMRHNGTGKGYGVAVDATRDAGYQLVVAGPSPLPEGAPDHVTHAGFVGVKERAQLLANARALIAPSLFLEPMCGAMIEAFMSGTPVISTDWGAFSEYNVHGRTGFRCRTHSEFVWAIQNIDLIRPRDCRSWSKNFMLDRVATRYDAYFRGVLETRDGHAGWYQPHPERVGLPDLAMTR